MARVFVDTSAIYALIDRDDANHTAATSALQRLRKSRAEPVITNFIVAETHAMLLSRLGAEVARRWLLAIAWPVERIRVEDEAAAVEIIGGHTDKTYSYTDATSFAVMRRLCIRTVLSFDRHFAQFGFDLA
jgi:predicted nucleic acid-binding protein